jgi:hypothetical protein
MPLANVTSTTNFTVSYDFEVYLKTGIDLESALVALEGYQLQHAAYFMGLLDCGAVSFGRSGSFRRLTSQELTIDFAKRCTHCNSRPIDQGDPCTRSRYVPLRSHIVCRYRRLIVEY